MVMMFLVNASLINAQTFDEWFKQKETQIKYLVEQIGALKAYGEVVKRGYDIAHNGLTNVFNS
jgi:3-phenylpropionate/cinnamic acid dioxygenase small subunit